VSATDPYLLMQTCRKLFLRRHEVMVQIGVHEFEKTAPQRMWIDVDLYVPLAHTTPQNDHIAEVVAQRIARGHIGLQETLCDDLVDELMRHPGVQAVRLSTCKPDVYPDCDAVGVEVFRAKPLA